MQLEDFPMDAHACPLKFGSCKSLPPLRATPTGPFPRWCRGVWAPRARAPRVGCGLPEEVGERRGAHAPSPVPAGPPPGSPGASPEQKLPGRCRPDVRLALTPHHHLSHRTSPPAGDQPLPPRFRGPVGHFPLLVVTAVPVLFFQNVP